MNSSQVLQQSLKDLDSAYRHFFLRVKKGEKPGFPRFKKKGLKDSFRYPQVKREGEHWFVSLASPSLRIERLGSTSA
jgi:putative transposase